MLSKIFHNLSLAIGLTLASAFSLATADEPLLTLDEAIQAAIANNFGLLIAGAEPTIAEARVSASDAQFDFELFGSAQVGQSEQTTTFSQTTGTSSDRRNFTLGARKAFALGTSVTAQTNLNRSFSNAGVNTSNLSQEADFSLTVRQPLLDGFGRDANLTNLYKARAALTGSKADLKSAILATLSETIESYWNVSRLQQTLALRKSSLKVAEELLDETIEKERVGTATKIEILQARAARAEQIENIIGAQRDLQNAIDALFAQTGQLISGEFNSNLAVADLILPENALEDFINYWNDALANEPSLTAQEAVISQREFDRLNARNSTRPTLDLVMTGAYVGLDDEDADTAYNRALDRSGNQWSVGLEFSIPWANREAEASLITSNKRIEQAEWRLLELKQELFRTVRATWRDIDTELKRLEATNLSVELQEATFDQEKEKYDQGVSVFRDVLEAQRRLDEARIRHIQAKTNLILARVRMDKLTGRLLNIYRVTH